MRSIALALVVLIGSVALGFGARALMKASSDPNDPCIGCGLVVLGGIGFGVVAASIILGLGLLRSRDRQRHEATGPP